MKKPVKVLIALILIAGLAVGAYFVFRQKDNSAQIYSNIQEITIITSGNTNITKAVDECVYQMIQIIDEKNMDIPQVDASLKEFVAIKESYAFVITHVCNNASQIKQNNGTFSVVKQATSALNSVKSIYNDAYNYLKNTYFKIKDSAYNVETMKSYIVNFENVFKEVKASYNEFFYKTCVAYSHALSNSMQHNNAYKLHIEQAGTLLNAYFNSQESYKNSFLTLANSALTKAENTNEKYFNNKAIYDNLIEQSLNLNLTEIYTCEVTNQTQEYINNHINNNEEQGKIITNYITYVARG